MYNIIYFVYDYYVTKDITYVIIRTYTIYFKTHQSTYLFTTHIVRWVLFYQSII